MTKNFSSSSSSSSSSSGGGRAAWVAVAVEKLAARSAFFAAIAAVTVTVADLRGDPRLKGSSDQNVPESFCHFRVIVGLKTKRIRPGDEKFGDDGGYGNRCFSVFDDEPAPSDEEEDGKKTRHWGQLHPKRGSNVGSQQSRFAVLANYSPVHSHSYSRDS